MSKHWVMNTKLNYSSAKLNFRNAKLNFRSAKLNFRNAIYESTLKSPNMRNTGRNQGGATPLSLKGRGRGGVCNIQSTKKIHTPPRPLATPPLRGVGKGDG